jgi:hypothetical protein
LIVLFRAEVDSVLWPALWLMPYVMVAGYEVGNVVGRLPEGVSRGKPFYRKIGYALFYLQM